jgi:hypothetical protein
MARPYRDGRAVHPRQSPGCQLEKLKLEAEADGSHAKIRRIDLYDRSSPNVRSDQPLSLGDFVSVNDVVGLDVHGWTPCDLISSVLAITGCR